MFLILYNDESNTTIASTHTARLGHTHTLVKTKLHLSAPSCTHTHKHKHTKVTSHRHKNYDIFLYFCTHSHTHTYFRMHVRHFNHFLVSSEPNDRHLNTTALVLFLPVFPPSSFCLRFVFAFAGIFDDNTQEQFGQQNEKEHKMFVSFVYYLGISTLPACVCFTILSENTMVLC